MDKPPLDIEQAVDLILATPAMFSRQNEAQRDFGRLIVEEYYSKLKEENKNDPVAYKYLVNLFAIISSAVRAFGVQRDIFQTSWKSIEDIKKRELDAANRLTDYSPFRGGHFWERFQGFVISLFGGGGLGAAAGIVINPQDFHSLLVILLALVGWAAGIIILDYILHKRKDAIIKNILKKYPAELTTKWKNDTISYYKKIIRNFIILAIKVREEYYRDIPTINDLRIYDYDLIPHIQFKNDKLKNSPEINESVIQDYIDKIVEKHFVF